MLKICVVISFKISIFALADTAYTCKRTSTPLVVISFKISIFALADTAQMYLSTYPQML